jgi:hypothetical protein
MKGVFPAYVFTRLAAFAVDSRTTNSGSTAISGTYSDRFSICSSKVRAAISPISSKGWRTVVRLGRVYAAFGISSNPITEISSGMRSPASSMARMAPIAAKSLNANRAVNARDFLSSSLVAS